MGDRKLKIEPVTYDCQTDAKRAQQLAGKFTTDGKMDVMTAPFGSAHTKTVASRPARAQLLRFGAFPSEHRRRPRASMPAPNRTAVAGSGTAATVNAKSS